MTLYKTDYVNKHIHIQNVPKCNNNSKAKNKKKNI